jgi:gamma-glutamyl hercynylcysteine S-oxide hydrolase
MCRLAAYIGTPIPLQRFLLDPPHSLVVQAWAPQELCQAKLNADGFGFGWYTRDSRPATYRNILPIWNDDNLNALGRSLEYGLYLAMVRSATPGNPLGLGNTQPFSDHELMFTHNGYIRDFHADMRLRIDRELTPEIHADIQGNTDSEYLFALLRQMLSHDSELTIERALLQLCSRLTHWLEDTEALLNFVLTDGERLYAVRHTLNNDCPSLYYTTDDDYFPDGQLIASERLTGSDYWQPVPEHHLLIIDRHEPPELIAL